MTTRIGPDMAPYRIQRKGQAVREEQLYWFPKDIPPPYIDNARYVGLESIGLIVEDPTGRVPGSELTDDPDTLYEIVSHRHIPKDQRPPLPRCYTRHEEAATSYYDLNPDTIDPNHGLQPDSEPVAGTGPAPESESDPPISE